MGHLDVVGNIVRKEGGARELQFGAWVRTKMWGSSHIGVLV